MQICDNIFLKTKLRYMYKDHAEKVKSRSQERSKSEKYCSQKYIT